MNWQKPSKAHHIRNKANSNDRRIGVAYGLNNQKGYQTRFIMAHRTRAWAAPETGKRSFEANSKSETCFHLPQAFCWKQIETTYGYSKQFNLKELQKLLGNIRDIDIKLDRKGDCPSWDIHLWQIRICYSPKGSWAKDANGRNGWIFWEWRWRNRNQYPTAGSFGIEIQKTDKGGIPNISIF